MSGKTKLKPCPLCGNTEVTVDKEWYNQKFTYSIGCGSEEKGSGCGLVLFGPEQVRLSEVAKRWNTRQCDGRQSELSDE